MNIIIVGCGKVGYTLAKNLADEKHNIIVVDKDASHIESVQRDIDCMSVVGNGAILSVLLEAEVESADFLIAVTGSDEINILTCLIARRNSKCRTIARIRNPEYSLQIEYIMKEIDISMTINPELATAREISRIMRYSKSISSNSFFKDRLNLLKIKVPINSELIGLKLSDVQRKLNCNILICVIERGDEIIIPTGASTIENDDNIFFVADHNNVVKFFEKIGYNYKKLNSFMIIGAGKISLYLIELLIKNHPNCKIKVIDNDISACEKLASTFQDISVVCGDATDKNILTQEGMNDVDAFIALTGIDEENIILSLFATSSKSTKVITKINHINFADALKDVHLDSIVNPESIASNLIISYIRASYKTKDSNIETLYKLCNDRVEGLGFVIREKSKIINLPIKDLKLKKNVMIAGIYRNGNVIRPNGNDSIFVGDKVVIITKDNKFKDIVDILDE